MANLVKTVNWLAIASVKTTNGLAIASVKTIKWLSNVASTLLTGITAYWKLDESSGNAADSKGTNTGVNTTVTYSTWKINNGAVFNNVATNRLNCGTTWEINTAAFSISCWINTSKTTQQYIFTNMDDNSNEYFLFLTGLITASKVSVYFKDKASPWYHTWTISVCDGVWHHIVVTCDSSTIKSYVDNVLDINVSTGNALVTTARQSNWWYRRQEWINSYPAFSGTIDEGWTWNKALSAAEVTELYNAGTWIQYPF